MQNDIEATLALLGRSRVRFIVVGGVAVVLHGYLRLTADLDLVIQLEEENVRRAIDAFSTAGFAPRLPVSLDDFANPVTRRQWAEEKNMQVLSLWSPERRGFEVDLFVHEPFEFEAAFDRAVRLKLQGTEIAVAAIEDLIALKRAAGRPRDLEDIAALESLKSAGGDDE